MQLRFYLLGKCDSKNPSAIPKKQIEQWSDSGIITYLGESNDVREFIKYASVVVLPSYYKEGIPRVLLEALAMSKPIITTINNGCKDLINLDNINKNDINIGNNGILIQPKNAHLLYKAILKFSTINRDELEKNALIESKKYDIKIINEIYKNRILDKYLLKTHNKNIVFVSNSCFSMFNFRLNTLQYIRDNGYQIHIIAPFDESTQKLIDNNFKCYDIFIDPKSMNPLKELRFIKELKNHIKTINPSIIINYTIKPVIYGSFIANRLKIQNIAITTGLGYIFIPNGIMKTILKKFVVMLYKIALKNTNEIWFLNKDDKNEFINLNITESSKTFILPSEGIDLNHFKPDFKKNENFKPNNKAQEQYLQNPPKDDEIRYLLIARMLYDKGVQEFIKAAKLHQNSLKH